MATRSLFLVSLLSIMGFMAAASRELVVLNGSESTLDGFGTEEARFERWLDAHGRTYKDEVEKSIRLAIFKDNLHRIEKHNRKSSSYRLGLNKFADLTAEEYKAQYLRLKVPEYPSIDQTHSFSYGSIPLEALPTAVDWRKKGAVTPIKDQGQCGSCWAFSTIGAVEGINQIATGKLISLSEQELVSCDVTNNTQGCEGGYMDDGFKYIIKNGGIDSENDYPYAGADDACDRSKDNTKVASISGYEDVPENQESELTKAVAHQPVSVAIDAGDFSFQLYAGGVFDGPCGTELDHGVVAAGYGTSGGDDFWIVKNSWGESWGEEGYIRMKRNVKQKEGLCGIAMMASYPTKTK